MTSMPAEGARHDSKAPPTIGVLISWFEESYSQLVASGVADVVREAGANLICYVGGRPNTPLADEVGANHLYDLVSPERIDGLVLISGALMQFLGGAAFEEFCRRFAPLPMVSIAVPVPGLPSVAIDNDPGLRQALHHLIDVHGCRRIAFVGGPPHNSEAVGRFEVFRDVLSNLGVAPDPALVAPGSFDYESGEAAVKVLLEERRTEFDALVAANDSMALGAIEALRARRLRVPEDVAVIGFDDTDAAAFASPSLTTVRQPLRDLGRVAARLLLGKMRGAVEPESLVLPTEAIIRESCGCPARTSHDAVGRSTACRSIPQTKPRGVIEGAALHSEWTTELLDALMADLAGTAASFLRTLDRVLGQALATGGDVWPWQHVLSRVRGSALPRLLADPHQYEHAERLLFQARDLLGDRAQRHQGQRRLAAESRARYLNDLGRRLMAADDLAAVGGALGIAMDELGVGAYFIARYERADSPSSEPQVPPDTPPKQSLSPLSSQSHEQNGALGPRRAVLVLARERGGAVAVADKVSRESFQASRLLPDDVLMRQTPFAFVAEPLFLGGDPIGYGLFDCTFDAGTFYDDVRQLLSSTLKRLEREAVLANLHRSEQERSHALEQAYLMTRQNQERLILSENMAALGRLTAGMAHEMNTPLAAVRMALDELTNLADEYQSSLGDPEVSVDDHRQIAREMHETVALATGAADRVAGFVEGIHFQTKHVGTDLQRFNAVTVIHDSLLLLRHALRKSGCSVSFEPSLTDIPLYGSPGRLAQVVTNLVTNAIDASCDRGGSPINIRLAPLQGRVILTISDGGSGIAPEDLQRIFDPMFTTKPFGEGTGLGLSIVHSIVVNDFHGTIEVDSQLDRGTTFTLHLHDSRGV